MSIDDARQSTWLSFDFWGTRIDARTHHPQDAAHLAYYFADHLCNAEPPAPVAIEFIGDDAAFVESAPHLRSVLRRRSPTSAWDPLDQGGPTPIPPFTEPPLSDRFKTIHASCAALPIDGERAIVISGESTAGKSAVLLGLLERGWHFLSDDTCVVDADSMVWPYGRPIGIRQQTRKILSGIRIPAGVGVDFTTFTGLTTCIRAADLGFSVRNRPAKWAWTVHLVKSNSFTVERLAGNALRLQLDVSRHLKSAVACIEDLCSPQTDAEGAPRA
jgi:hypothetical protein